MTGSTPGRSDARALLWRRGRWVALATALIAAVVAGGVVIAERRAAHAVDATTASADEVRPQPPVLGVKQFEVAVSDRPESDLVVVAAGPGFAALVDNTVTRYGADGTEQWHYRRTDTAITDVHGYDRARCSSQPSPATTGWWRSMRTPASSCGPRRTLTCVERSTGTRT